MFEINNRKIGEEYPPYVIAEISNNHLNNIKHAFELVYRAKESGVDALKIQTYTPDSLTIDCDKKDFIIQDDLWKGKTYYNLYKEIAMPLSWNKLLFDKAREVGISIFSSPFDEFSVDLLEDLNAPAYKIASFESKDPVLVKKIASTGKPLIISTGVSTFDEIMETIHIAKDTGNQNIAILHCISSYPTSVSDMNLRALLKLKELGVLIGLSDHSLPNLAPILSVAFGASIIEKHFTLSRGDGGPDAAFSLEPDELKLLKRDTYDSWKALGKEDILNDKARKGSGSARSLYFIKDIGKGETIGAQHIRSIRPGFGLAPKYLNEIVGMCAIQDIERGTAVSWELLNE